MSERRCRALSDTVARLLNLCELTEARSVCALKWKTQLALDGIVEPNLRIHLTLPGRAR